MNRTLISHSYFSACWKTGRHNRPAVREKVHDDWQGRSHGSTIKDVHPVSFLPFHPFLSRSSPLESSSSFSLMTSCQTQPITAMTSSSAMAERPRERARSTISDGESIWGYYRLRSYFSRHCDTTQFTLTHHMVNKPFLLLGLAVEYRSRRRRRRCANNIAADHHMLITLPGQLSWQRLRRSAVDLCSKAKKIALWATL